MSLYPVSTDRHLTFTAQDDDRPWHYPQRSSYHSELSYWQSSSRPDPHFPPPAPAYNNPYRPTPYHDLSDFHPSSHLLSDYSDSSHRVYCASPPLNYSPALSASSSSISQRSSVENNWNNSLYYIDDEDSSSETHFPSASAVKAEPEEHFIMELRATPCPEFRESQTPSSNVPLRATHACGEMLSMMGVFRLDPFIVRGNTWKPEENIGLTESPSMFEFTLDLPEESGCGEVWSADEQVEEQMPDFTYSQPDHCFSNDNSLYYRDSYTECARDSRERMYAPGY